MLSTKMDTIFPIGICSSLLAVMERWEYTVETDKKVKVILNHIILWQNQRNPNLLFIKPITKKKLQSSDLFVSQGPNLADFLLLEKATAKMF